VDAGRQTLDDILSRTIGDGALFSKKDMALLYALVYGVLRWRSRLDWMIAECSRIRMERIEPAVLNAIRIGLFQMSFLDRVPNPAAVHTTVEMTKRIAPPWVVRFVNAVLRTAAGKHGGIAFPDTEKDPETALAVTKSFPTWLIRRWLARFGIEETARLCDSINAVPPISIRTNTLLCTRPQLLESLSREVESAVPSRFSPEGIRFFHPSVPISKMQAFIKGWFQVQDEAAQLVCYLLNPKPGETVLDACAGLGGKTGHIGQMMQNRGRIVALDVSEEKLTRLRAEMDRIRIVNVSTMVHNLHDSFGKKFFRAFDRVLLDAPCSGLGVLRRNPDSKWRATSESIRGNRAKQIKFLETLALTVKSDGILVYAVCSMEPEENEEVVKIFLYRHPSFAIVNPVSWLSEKIGTAVDASGCLRTFPHRHEMDGFFSVCLRRMR